MITVDEAIGAPAFGRRLVAPVGEQVAPRRVEEGRIGPPDRLDRDHAPALVDRQPELKHRLLFAGDLRGRIGRLEIPGRGEERRIAPRDASTGGGGSGIVKVGGPTIGPGSTWVWSTVTGPGSSIGTIEVV